MAGLISDYMNVNRAKKIVSRELAIAGTEKLNVKKTNSTAQIGLGNKSPAMDKHMQLIGVVLLLLVGLSGSDYIYRKKCALTIIRIRQRGRLCQKKV
jgi:hypothetical protein